MIDRIFFPRDNELKAVSNSDTIENDNYEPIEYILKSNTKRADIILEYINELLFRTEYLGLNKNDIIGVFLSLDMFELLISELRMNCSYIDYNYIDYTAVFGLDIIIKEDINKPELSFKPMRYITHRDKIRKINEL